ncbi:hypothetical protein ISP15_10530 [Dyella jejuensis]|uniref:Uncharacterized protein n=1 Tax=Dyella jejuensis TaxID=1432009 RepID=A0ABW8JKN1_9GAMM
MGTILLRHVEGGGVAMHRFEEGGTAEAIPARYDLFKYNGGVNWGYKGTGVQALSYAVANIVLSLHGPTDAELHRCARAILDNVLCHLNGEEEHDVSTSYLLEVCGVHEVN